MAGEADKNVKSPNIFERAKDEFEAIIHKDKTHYKETHGTSDDIDSDTPIENVKGPNVFERAKEEIEALIETIHPKKEPKDHDSHKEKDDGGCFGAIGRRLEEVCSPSNGKKD